MFASTKTKDIAVRDDDGGNVDVTIRKLSWKQLRAAGEANTADAVKSANVAGPELLKAMRDVAAPPPSEKPKEDPAERYRRYQREAVLGFGVAKWTLDRPVKEGLDDLDEETVDLLHREILDLSLPPVDANAARGEA